MKLRSVTRALIGALIAAGAACEPEPLTEIMVIVDTDMIVPSELDGFRVEIRDPNDRIVHSQPFDLAGQVTLPADFGVLPRDGDASRQITVEVTALRGIEELFSTRAITTFVEGRKVYLQMFLARRCIGVECSPSETCRREGCVPADTPSFLEPVSFDSSSLGSASNDIPYEVLGDQSGVYLAGVYGAQLSHGGDQLPAPAGIGALVVAFAPDGTHRFTRGLPSTALSYANRVVLTKGGAIEATGYFGGTLTESSTGQTLTAGGSQASYVVRYSSQGKLEALDVVGIGTSNVQSFAFTALPDGRRVLGGTFAGTADFGVKNTRSLTSAGEDDAHVVMLEQDLSALWALGMGGPSRERVTGLAASADAIYAGGYFATQASFGTTELTGVGENGYVVRISPAGELIWARGISGGADDVVRDVALMPDGGVVVVGRTESVDLVAHDQPLPGSDPDAFVAALSPAGQLVWAKRFAGAGDAEAWSVALGQYAGEPALIVGGQFSGELIGDSQTLAAQGSDLFVAVLTPSGVVRFVQAIGGAGTEGRAEVGAFGARIWLAGEFQQSVGLASQSFTAAGASDILLVQLAP